MNLNELEQFGLDAKEAKVYLSCLKFEESHIVPIAEDVKLPRTTVFHILERLKGEGLIDIVLQNKRRIYRAQPPRKIITMLKNQGEKIALQMAKAEQIVPELARFYSYSPFQPRVRYFKGEEIKEIFEEILITPVDEIYYTGNVNQVDEIVGERYLNSWVKRKVSRGIWTKSIRSMSTESEKEIYEPTTKYLRKARYAPEGYVCPAHIYIYGDNVAVITSSKENFAIVTTSRDNANTMRSWFRALWNISK